MFILRQLLGPTPIAERASRLHSAQSPNTLRMGPNQNCHLRLTGGTVRVIRFILIMMAEKVTLATNITATHTSVIPVLSKTLTIGLLARNHIFK